MALQIHAETVPINTDSDGVVRVGGTRVRLETVVYCFKQGDSPEQIVDSYDVLALADVYAVIAYYLNHREEVEEYIHQRQIAAEEIRREIEARQPEMVGLRARLIARKQQKT